MGRAVATARVEGRGGARFPECSCAGHAHSSHSRTSGERLQQSVADGTPDAEALPSEQHPVDAPCDEERCELDSFTTLAKLTSNVLEFDSTVVWWAISRQDNYARDLRRVIFIDEFDITSPTVERSRLQVWRI